MNHKKDLAIEDVFEEYSTLILKYCFTHINNNYHDAEEITNEVMALLCKKWRQLKKDNILAWLYRCADMYIKKYLSKKHKESKRVMYIEDLNKGDEPAAEAEYNPYVFDEDIERYIEEIYQKLTENEQELFEYRYRKRMTLMETASLLQIPYSTLYDKFRVLDKKIKALVHEIIENTIIH